MNSDRRIFLRSPYLIFIGDTDDRALAKTGLGIVQWCPELVAGQLRFEGNSLDLGTSDMTIADAVRAGVKSLVIGVAPVGGKIDDNWALVLEDAAAAGLDIVSGLHLRLKEFPGVAAAAKASGAALIDIRNPPANLPIATGKKRTGKRVLMVGTDCAVGKKYTALGLTKSLQERTVKATFRATGQTGIMIAGTGIPIDAVVSDFVAGAAELVSPDNDADHWDVIEGQGSLFNASYAGVSLGLLHGSQPDAIVVCHDPTRETNISCPEMKLPSVADCIEINLTCGRLTNPEISCVGISVNTSGLKKEARGPYLKALSQETGLACVDPLIEGCGEIADVILTRFGGPEHA
ncbi:DUF1611 domain-containing protein [Paremcibacter congregatus]|uniref:EBNA-1 nuclear protein n=1 Tax=Paremcibacter congregatus TaxID=2043170 RepID=A0A2G4YT19_9PROT|nr:DUF1611 domain-containing protein [Paremcibacter congregatus]PHZ85475.1 EBNA-1 nuclear protein [Paremcibacter congregatus]QDE28026.1 DUF1611 domain-containing protein [Paremcibacter congregatus]